MISLMKDASRREILEIELELVPFNILGADDHTHLSLDLLKYAVK